MKQVPFVSDARSFSYERVTSRTSDTITWLGGNAESVVVHGLDYILVEDVLPAGVKLIVTPTPVEVLPEQYFVTLEEVAGRLSRYVVGRLLK